MSVSIVTLKTMIKAAFDAEKAQTSNPDASIDRIAEAIAQAVAIQIVQGINTAVVVPVLANAGGAVAGTITITASAV